MKCISKGKAAKRYEFGCKASLVYTEQNRGHCGDYGIFRERDTLAEVLQQVERLSGKAPRSATVDRGYRGNHQVASTQIDLPHSPKKRDSAYQKQKKQKRFRRRAAIEPVISHLKHEHRSIRNYLRGHKGDSIQSTASRITPPPTTSSPSYKTTDCPGVIDRRGSSKMTSRDPSGRVLHVASAPSSL